MVAVLLLLAGCGSGEGWSKPGADQAATAREYRECRELTDVAVGTQADIDHDIAVSRSSDVQHSAIVRMQADDARQQTRERAARLIGGCMKAKGFSPAK